MPKQSKSMFYSKTFFVNHNTWTMTSRFFNGFPWTIEWSFLFLLDVQGALLSNICLPESRFSLTIAHFEFYAPKHKPLQFTERINASPGCDRVFCVLHPSGSCALFLILLWTHAQPSSLSSPASPSVRLSLISLARLQLLSAHFP